jgi:hypothetical protein
MSYRYQQTICLSQHLVLLPIHGKSHNPRSTDIPSIRVPNHSTDSEPPIQPSALPSINLPQSGNPLSIPKDPITSSIEHPRSSANCPKASILGTFAFSSASDIATNRTKSASPIAPPTAEQSAQAHPPVHRKSQIIHLPHHPIAFR